MVATVVWAGPAAAETTLDVDAGYGGFFVAGRDVPVRVTISADRLVRGTLEVSVGTGEDRTPVAMAVEVPGGSQKQFLLVASAGVSQSPDVVARLRQDDRVLASGQTTVQVASDTELVGLLPGAVRGRAVPGPATLAVDAGTARFFAVGEAELEEAPASLGPLSTLAADVEELGRLSPGARQGVLRWVAHGGRLLVDAAKGQRVPGLPDGWQPGLRGRAAAGLGEVVATDGAVAAGRWSGLVEPSGWSATTGRFAGGPPLASSLASDAGLRTPELRWLVGFLVVYVLAVGPAVFFAVRRRGRPELAWVAVPLVAIVFSTGSYLVGGSLRNATRLVHATIVSSGTAGSTATSYVGVFSRRGETVRIGFPAQWSNGPYDESARAAATAHLVTRTPDGPEARLPLDAGQFGMVHASGPVRSDGGLEVAASARPDGRITGTVRNATSFRLDEIAVFVSSSATLVGALAPGEDRSFTTDDAPQAPGDGLAFRVWAGLRMGRSDGPPDFALWQAALRHGGPNFLAQGAVVAAGWTRELRPEVRLDGRLQKPEGRALVLGRQPVEPGAGAALDLAVRRDVVRDPFVTRFPGPRAANTASVVRFVLPDGADTSRLVLKSPFGSAEVWTDGAWRPAACEGAGCRALGARPGVAVACPPEGPCPPQPPFARVAPGNVELAMPAGSVRDGVVYARVPGPASFEHGGPLTIGRAT